MQCVVLRKENRQLKAAIRVMEILMNITKNCHNGSHAMVI